MELIFEKIDALVPQFMEIADIDNNLPVKNCYNTVLHIGFRPWVFSLISDLKKSTILPLEGLSDSEWILKSVFHLDYLRIFRE